MKTQNRVLLIICGGIAAYKTPDFIRRLRERKYEVSCILTEAGQQFVSPLSLSAVCNEKIYQNLFDLNAEAEMGHIQLSRSADLILVMPATANFMAKAAHGLADDLATTTLLATDTPVMMAPAMNVRMWEHQATQSNYQLLKKRGIQFVGPVEGDMACGEYGFGRMAEPHDILDQVDRFFKKSNTLKGFNALVTSGPTHEPIDPVRYIANRSSGKQGHAIAQSLANAGCEVTLISGPTKLTDPSGVNVVHIESAREMLNACEAALPCDIAICAAAVADWHVANYGQNKIKKTSDQNLPLIELAENPDILATLSKKTANRPKLVIGFAAETQDVVRYAQEKRLRKQCDWILANDVSSGTNTFGGDDNQIHFITNETHEMWERLKKTEVADKLTDQIALFMKDKTE